MSRRTKGFFEQAGPGNPKNNNWHHNKQSRSVLSDKPPNVGSPALPPIPATAQAKSKLKTFQFEREPAVQDGDSAVDERDMKIAHEFLPKGDAATVPKRRSLLKQDKAVHPMSDGATHKKISLPHANTFPSTPAESFTLDELCGHVAEKHQVQDNDGPEEILGWNPNSSYSGESPSRKRKRAQSSSPEFPTASSERYFRPLESETNAQPTPVVDPAAELWRRYGGNSGCGVDGLKVTGLGLAFQASPRPLETPVKSTGFRRWASTGNEWPSSKSKRAKVRAPADGSIWSHGPSKVAAMVEKMQASLAIQQAREHSRSRPATKDPSSSSPLPAAGASLSPRRRITDATPSKRNAPVLPAVRVNEKRQNSSQTHIRPPTTKPIIHESSARRVLASQQHPQRAGSGTIIQPGSQAITSQRNVQQHRIPAQPAAVDAQDFDEFDDDLTLDDLEKVRSPVKDKGRSGRLAHVTNTHAPPPHAAPTAFEEADFDDDMKIEDDDDFGLDELDEQGLIAAAELCATQASNTRASLSIIS